MSCKILLLWLKDWGDISRPISIEGDRFAVFVVPLLEGCIDSTKVQRRGDFWRLGLRLNVLPHLQQAVVFQAGQPLEGTGGDP